MANDTTSIIQAGAAFIGNTDLISTPPKEMSNQELATAYSILDVMEKQVIGKRKTELKEYMLPMVEETGVAGKTKSKTLKLDDGAKLEARWFKGKASIDHDLLKALLKDKGIPEEKVYPLVPTFEEARLEALLQLGDITVDELTEVSDVADGSFRLYVTKPASVKALIP